MSNRCSCNIAGLLSVNYSGIISASINGGTTVEISEDGVVLIGPTINTLNMSAYPFSPGGDWFLGATCPSSASAQVQWITKYDCFNDETYFIPQSGGKASVVGGPINGVYLGCDPNIVSTDFNASAQSGPTTPYTKDYRKDGFNLVYTGNPIEINSGSPKPYLISMGEFGTLRCYLQSFSLSISPPSPSTVSYSFVFAG